MTTTAHHRDDGVMVIRNGEIAFTLWVPSSGRSRLFATNPFLPIANVCVDETEHDEYAKNFRAAEVKPGSIQTHNISGNLAAIHNAILDKMRPEEESFLMSVDDDISGMIYMMTVSSRRSKIRDIPRILEIWMSSFVAARDIGSGLFYYAQTPIPSKRRSYIPFSLRNWGHDDMMGYLDPLGVRCDETLLVKEDIDICLTNIAKNKVAFQDNRYAVLASSYSTNRVGGDTGGPAATRLTSTEHDAVSFLKVKWGENIISPGKNRGAGTSVTVHVPK